MLSNDSKELQAVSLKSISSGSMMGRKSFKRKQRFAVAGFLIDELEMLNPEILSQE